MHTYVSVIGNLTRDVELRYTPSGLAIGNTAIASTYKYTINNEKKEEICFIDIAFMGKTAEIASQYLKKGSKVFVDGRLKFDQWTDNNGQNRSKHSIVVDKMVMLDGKKQDNKCDQTDQLQHKANTQNQNNEENTSEEQENTLQ